MNKNFFYTTLLNVVFCVTGPLSAKEHKVSIKGGVYVSGKEIKGDYTPTEIKSFLSKPLGREDDIFSFYNDKIGEISTCNDYRKRGNPSPTEASNVTMINNFAFIRQCTTLERLANSKPAKNDFIDQSTTLKNIDLIPAKMFKGIVISSNEYFEKLEERYGEKTISDLVKDKEMTILENTDTMLIISEVPDSEDVDERRETWILEEIARGDFTNSGYQEILCRLVWQAAGSASNSETVVLRRLSKDGTLYYSIVSGSTFKLKKEDLLSDLLRDNKKLNELDINLNDTYKKLGDLLCEKDKKSLLKEQRNWLKERNKHLDSIEKLMEMYQERLLKLQKQEKSDLNVCAH